LIFWIENLLIPYLIGGNAGKPTGSRAQRPIRAAGGGNLSAMKVMFVTWLVLIATGLVFYTVIGLAHN
jgi:hypothetical protein